MIAAGGITVGVNHALKQSASAVLRAGRDDDAAAIIGIIGNCWAEYPGCVMDLDGEVPELRALASHCARRGGTFWVAEAAGAVAGLVCAWPLADGSWELAKMYVARAQRGGGAAQALADAAESHARAQGAARMALWSDTRFDRAHRFYEKRSYVRDGPLRVLGDKSNSIEFAYAKPLAGIAVAPLGAAPAASAVMPLAEVLAACVAAGAAISFIAPLPVERARAFWRDAAHAAARGERLLFAAWLDGTIVGTVQVSLAMPENQPHRAEVQKMMVHPAARRRGIGRMLLDAAEAGAAAAGRTMLLLDTRAGDAGEALYRAAGWAEAGRVPDYALSSDGTLHDTVFYFKRVGPARPAASDNASCPAPGSVQKWSDNTSRRER